MLFLEQQKYKFLYKFFSILSDIKLVDKLDRDNKFRVFPPTTKYDVLALRFLRKYMLLLTYQIESNKMNKAVLYLINDVDSLSIYNTDFNKLRIDYENEVDDINDVETYYNIISKNSSK